MDVIILGHRMSEAALAGRDTCGAVLTSIESFSSLCDPRLHIPVN